MKSCNGCQHAQWDRTTTGRLHPSGDGACTYKVKPIVVPACWPVHQRPFVQDNQMFRINCRTPLAEHCPTYASGGDKR